MARVFASMAVARLQGHERDTTPGVAELTNLQAMARASITISGRNGETTRALARMLYPDDPEPQIMQEDLGDLGAVPAPVAQ